MKVEVLGTRFFLCKLDGTGVTGLLNMEIIGLCFKDFQPECVWHYLLDSVI